METVTAIALVTALGGNIWLLVRAAPSLGRALAGPQPIAAAPSRPPAEVIHLAARHRLPALHVRPAAMRLAA